MNWRKYEIRLFSSWIRIIWCNFCTRSKEKRKESSCNRTHWFQGLLALPLASEPGSRGYRLCAEKVWNYITQFAEFNRFTNSPVANYKGELYSLPFNMYTFNKMWGVVTPEEAEAKIEEQKKEAGIKEPMNLEEQAISFVGTDIYEKLIKGYTEKQWGRKCTELPAFIIKRLPVRYTYDNNYFNDSHQGIPKEGYTSLIERSLAGSTLFNIDFIGIIRNTIHDSIGKSTFTITDLLVPFTFTELRTKDC